MTAFIFGMGSLIGYRRKEASRRASRIFDLEHELGVGGHNDGYTCMECWRLEDEERAAG